MKPYTISPEDKAKRAAAIAAVWPVAVEMFSKPVPRGDLRGIQAVLFERLRGAGFSTAEHGMQGGYVVLREMMQRAQKEQTHGV